MDRQKRDVHPVSLKVLRLSRPSLSRRFPLISHQDDNESDVDETFALGSTLSLPPSFGTTYVGEPFACTLCANNELEGDPERQVSNVKLTAEMQTPSGTLDLDLQPDEPSAGILPPGQPLQRNVRFDLREEGNHTLAINISYSETIISKDHAASGRVRTFRKLYQFIARPCLTLRTKVSTSAHNAAIALEAQVDNLADGPIVLTNVTFFSKPAFRSKSLNWDAVPLEEGEGSNRPIMSPREVFQIAFVITEVEGGASRKEITRDGRIVLGQVGLRWRSEMGQEGFLTTGMLTTKRR